MTGDTLLVVTSGRASLYEKSGKEANTQPINRVALRNKVNHHLRLRGFHSHYIDGQMGRTKRLSPLDIVRHLYLLFHFWSEQIMPSKSKPSVNGRGWAEIEFVNARLDAEDREDFLSWYKHKDTNLTDMIAQAMVQQYKFSFTWDDSNQCYIVTITGKADNPVNASRSMSSRSDDWYEALAMTLYKHYVLSQARRWEGDTERNNWG